MDRSVSEWQSGSSSDGCLPGEKVEFTSAGKPEKPPGSGFIVQFRANWANGMCQHSVYPGKLT